MGYGHNPLRYTTTTESVDPQITHRPKKGKKSLVKYHLTSLICHLIDRSQLSLQLSTNSEADNQYQEQITDH